MKVLSTLFTHASGSMAGITATAGAQGQVFGKKAGRVASSSRSQANVQTSLSATSTLWRSLTDQQRAGWLSIEHSGVSGKQLFAQSLFNRKAFFLSAIIVAPVLPTFPDMAVKGVTHIDTGLSVSLHVQVPRTPADYGYLVDATPPLSHGTMSPRNSQWRRIFILSVFGSGIVNFNITQPWMDRFGSSLSMRGKKVFVRVVPVHRPSGLSGVKSHGSTTVFDL